MKWDECRGTSDNNIVFLARHFWNRWGVRISLHKMLSPDLPDCYHTHPAHAIRIILKGGYVEELPNLKIIKWGLLGIGWVKPAFAHRIHHLPNRVSYSLWIRFKKIADIKLVGDGWERD